MHVRHVMQPRLPRSRNEGPAIDLSHILVDTGNMESNSSEEDERPPLFDRLTRMRQAMDAANRQERQRNPDPLQQLAPMMVQMIPQITEMITGRVQNKKYGFVVRYIAYLLQMIAFVLLSRAALQGQSGTWYHALTPLFIILYGIGFVVREAVHEAT